MTAPSDRQILESQPTGRFSLWDLCLGVIPAVAILPMMIGQAARLWAVPETKLGLFVWLFVIVIVALRARGGVTRHLVRINAALLVFIVGCSFFAWGLLNWSLNWVHFSGCLFLVAWALGRCSQRLWHEVVAWGCLLALTIPISLVYRDLDIWISSLAAEFASTTLDSFGIPHFLDGFRFTLKSGQFETSMATSPRLGLYAVTCLTAIWCWLWGRSFAATVFTILGATAGLLVTRYLAVLVVSCGLQNYQNNWAVSGIAHYVIGLGAFAACILLMMLFDLLVQSLFRPIPSSSPEYETVLSTVNAILDWPKMTPFDEAAADSEEIAAFRAYSRQFEPWRLSWYTLDWDKNLLYRLAIFGCASVCGLGIIPVWIATLRNDLVERPQAAPQLQLDTMWQVVKAELLPANAGGFRRARFEQTGESSTNKEPIKLGPLTAKWTYLWAGYLVTVDLQAPKTSWQAPLNASDSKATKTSVTIKDDPASKGWAWFDCRLTNALGGDAYLMQCCLEDDLTASEFDQPLSSNNWPILSKLSGKSESLDLKYDIQVYCESGVPLSIDQFKELQGFFEFIRRELQSKLPANQLQHSLAP